MIQKYILTLIFSTLFFCNSLIIYSQRNNEQLNGGNNTVAPISNSLDIMQYKDLLWFNCDRPEDYLSQENVLFLLVNWNNLHETAEQTILKVQKIKRNNLPMKVIFIYNIEHEAEQSYAHIRAHLLENRIELPLVVVKKTDTIDGVRDCPTSTLFSPKHGVIKTYATLEDLDQLTSDFKAEYEKSGNENLYRYGEHFHKISDDYPDPLLSHMGYVVPYPENDWVFISQPSEHRILIAGVDGSIKKVLGHGVPRHKNGTTYYASYNHPQGMYWSTERQTLFVADTYNNCVRKIDFEIDRTASVVFESSNEIDPHPADIAEKDGELYIVMEGFGEIWKMNMDTEELSVLKNNLGEKITLVSPTSITITEDNFIYIVEKTTGELVKISLEDFSVSYVEIDFVATKVQYGDSKLVVVSAYGDKLVVLDDDKVEYSIGGEKASFKNGKFDEAYFYEPNGITFMNGLFYVIESGNNMLRSVSLRNKKVSVVEFYDVRKYAGLLQAKDGQGIDLEPMYINPEFNQFDVVIEENAGYVLDGAHGNNILDVGLFPSNIDMADDKLDDGKGMFYLEGAKAQGLVEIVVYVTYYEDVYPRRYYQKTTTYRIPLLIDEGASAKHEIIIPLIDSKD